MQSFQPSDPDVIMGIDPGDTNGFAVLNAEGKVIAIGQGKREEMFNQIIKWVPSILVVENFRLRSNKAMQQSGSTFEASQMIGAARLYCHMNDAKIVIQDPSLKPLGYKLAGIEPPKNHSISHQTDAYAHAMYYIAHNMIKELSND